MFLQQDYAGPKELVVLNSFPGHQYVGEFPNVRIINLKERPKSLGDCRNVAIEHCQGTHIVTWDDDDAYLPHYLSAIAESFGDHEWIWLNRQFFAERNRIKGIVRGSANVVAFTKEAWRRVGGYAPIGCGEDRNFVGRLTAQAKGATIDIPADRIGFVYCWNNNAYHVSGLGDDRPKLVPSYERARLDLEHRFKLRRVPLGQIHLQPKTTHDYMAMASEYMVNAGRTGTDSETVCIVMLGRYGDIINILPFCQHVHDTYGKPKLMVSREFLSLLDGVSYVDPYPVEFDNSQLGTAMALARQHFKLVIQAQIWGKGHTQVRHCDSYNKESWRMVGMLHRFLDPSLIPVFDRRDLAREEALYNKVRTSHKPMLLVQVQNSASSPFPQGQQLQATIMEKLSPIFDVIDLSEVRAERIYDLLGLMERATAMVSIDTSLLHLSSATNLPVVALVNPAPWLGTIMRTPNCFRRINYHLAARMPDGVINEVKAAAMNGWTGEVYHVVEHHEHPPCARIDVARASWARAYAQGVTPAHLMQYPRKAQSVGESRDVPFLKDVLGVALNVPSESLIVLSNDDTIFHDTLIDRLKIHVAQWGPCCLYRCEVDEPGSFVGAKTVARDLFCFKAGWLKDRWDWIPDFLIGFTDWDLMLACLIRQEHGIETTTENISRVLFPAELELGLVAHVKHDGYWVKTGINEQESVGYQYNRKLFKAWAELYAPGLRFDERGAVIGDNISDVEFSKSIARPRSASGPAKAPTRQLFHVVERHDESKPDPRKLQAWQSWDHLYQKGVIPVHVWEYPRTAREIRDVRSLPYLKDVLKVAIEQAGANDIIFWTNDDNWLHPDLIARLRFQVPVYGAVTSHRCDFSNGNALNPKQSPEIIAKTGKMHMGRDLFAFTGQWISERWNELPDYLLGASEFDLGLACMVRLAHGIQSTRQNLEEVMFPAELPKGYVAHVMHRSVWSKPQNINSAPSQKHNRACFKQWASIHLPDLKFHKNDVI